MLRDGLSQTGVHSPSGSDHQTDKRALTESVAYALWEERKRRDVPDDPEADWYRAEELVTELWNHRPLDNN